MSYKATKPGLVSVLYLSMRYMVLLFIRATFSCIVSFHCYVCCLLVVLVKLSVLAKSLARKTPLLCFLEQLSSPLQFLALV